METYRFQTTIDNKGHIKIDLPTSLPHGEVEIVMVIHQKEKLKEKYDFSDLTGRLKWNGDALLTQRALRDEWQ